MKVLLVYEYADFWEQKKAQMAALIISLAFLRARQSSAAVKILVGMCAICLRHQSPRS